MPKSATPGITTMPFTTVLFDVDGTLIDSNGAHALTWQQALAEHDRPVPLEDVRRMIGMGGDKLLRKLANIDEQSRRRQSHRRTQERPVRRRAPDPRADPRRQGPARTPARSWDDDGGGHVSRRP